MISVYPCRNKLFKARDWKWGGRGEVPGEEETKKKGERGGERTGENEAKPSGRKETERVYDSAA